MSDIQIIVKRKVAVGCDNCGEDATRKHTYLLEGNARSNPASSAYGKDDCSWCSDYEEFRCEACYKDNKGRAPHRDGYSECSTFTKGDRFSHMFEKWSEEKAPYLMDSFLAHQNQVKAA